MCPVPRFLSPLLPLFSRRGWTRSLSSLAMFTPRDDPTSAQIIDDTLLSLTGSAGDSPSTAVSNSVNLAKKSAWNTSLTVITNARSFQYNFTGEYLFV